MFGKEFDSHCLELKKKKSKPIIMGEKSRLAGLLYNYLQFVILIEFLLGGILLSVQY